MAAYGLRGLRPGDVVLVQGSGAVPALIRWVTRSPWTHAALVLFPAEAGQRWPLVLQVGERRHVARLQLFDGLRWVALRPRLIGEEILPEVARAAVQYALRRHTRTDPGYPTQELPIYALSWLPRRWSRWLLQRDPRGVCSVETARSLYRVGVICRDAKRRVIPEDLVTPGDLSRQHWRVVGSS